MHARELFPLLKAAFHQWVEDRSPRLAAALSYYALFAVTPLLLISIAIAGLVFGEEAARGDVVRTVSEVVGETAGRAIEEVMRNARQSVHSGTLAALIGFALLLFGASGVFNHLKESLNAIWNVAPRERGGLVRFLRKRFLSFAMVLAVGFLLLVSLIISAALAAGGRYVGSRLPGGETLWQVVNLVVSLAVITFLFALIFRYVPDIRVAWRDVWMGAAFTAILFTIGQTLIGFYLGRSNIATAYGAAGSVVVILVWIYYSSLIVFFGAEFAEVYARRRREGVTQPRPRSSRRVLPAVVASEPPRPGVGKVAPVATGCAGLVVGLLLGVVSAVVGIFVTALTAAAKKLWK